MFTRPLTIGPRHHTHLGIEDVLGTADVAQRLQVLALSLSYVCRRYLPAAL